MAEYQRVSCPDDDCGWSASYRWLPATREDPGCFADEEPPDDCPDCGASLEGEDAEPDYDDPFDDGDRAYDMAKGEGWL